MASHYQDRREFHPAVSISSWLIIAIAIELAAPAQLFWLAAAMALLLLRAEALQGFGRLLWRARWLLLTLACLYAWTIPGALIWPSSDFSPTAEGVLAGMDRIVRLTLLLAALARLLAEFSPPQLAGGIYLLTYPLTWLGLDRRALAVRLALTLERLQRAPVGREWLDALKSPVDDDHAGPDEIRLTLARAGLRDALVLAGAIVLLSAVLIRLAP